MSLCIFNIVYFHISFCNLWVSFHLLGFCFLKLINLLGFNECLKFVSIVFNIKYFFRSHFILKREDPSYDLCFLLPPRPRLYQKLEDICHNIKLQGQCPSFLPTHMNLQSCDICWLIPLKWTKLFSQVLLIDTLL